MDAAFWHNKWEKNQIGFHEENGSLLIQKHFTKLGLPSNSRLFLPLCGKTKDIHWLLSKGYKVAGAELSEHAITQLFEELHLKPYIEDQGTLKHYKAKDIDIFVGDVFDLSPKTLGPIDAILDRAALIALPLETRKQYTAHLNDLTANAPQLLITLDYNQAERQGPPFSISPQEVDEHYESTHKIKPLERIQTDDLRGNTPAHESAWLLS